MPDLFGGAIVVIVALFGAYNTYLFATLESRLTQKFDLRYILRREIEIMIRDRDTWRLTIEKRLDSIETSVNDIKRILMER